MWRSGLQEIPISEARRRLPQLLREIDRDPEVGYRILVHDRPVAELRSPRGELERPNAGLALLRAAEKIARSHRKRRRRESVAANYKEILYGKNGLLGPRRPR